MNSPVSERLRFAVFVDADADDLAALLADSSIARNITTNGSTPERPTISRTSGEAEE